MVRFILALLCLGVATPALAAESEALQRGRYLVERISLCGDCHTPRDRTGQLDLSRWLGGAPIEMTPTHPVPGWATFAPPLVGMPAHYTEAALVMFLETGARPDGSQAAPPMPPYRFSYDDALAIVEYLKWLPTQ